MFYKQFAADYNCAAYGAGNYNSNESCQTLTNSGNLADTGTNVAVGVTGGVLLIAIGLASFILLRRKNVKKTTK